jgi:hypothetical protein
MRALAVTALLMMTAACASPTLPSPNPTPSLTAAVNPSLPAASGVPAPTLTEPPTSPTPTPTPTGLHVGGMATVIVDHLRQVADPMRPNDHAWQSPYGYMQAGQTLGKLSQGDVVFILESGVFDERPFWKVATDDFVGCCAPFGWIVAADDVGSDTLAAIQPECPDAAIPLTTSQLLDLGSRAALVCFGSSELRLTGLLRCSLPIADAGAFVQSPWEPNPQRPQDCVMDDHLYSIGGDALRPFSESGSTVVQRVTLSGHFDDPESSGCVWIDGNFANFVPPEGGPVETAAFNCRETFVATDVAKE